MKKISFFVYANIALTALFTLLSLSFHADISLVAFPVSLLFTLLLAYMTVVRLLRKEGVVQLPAIRRALQYEPFVYISAFVLRRAGNAAPPFVLDLAGALVWVSLTLVSCVLLFLLREKAVPALGRAEARSRPPRRASATGSA